MRFRPSYGGSAFLALRALASLGLEHRSGLGAVGALDRRNDMLGMAASGWFIPSFAQVEGPQPRQAGWRYHRGIGFIHSNRIWHGFGGRTLDCTI